MLKSNVCLNGILISELKSHSNNRVVRVCDHCGEEKELSFSTYMRNKRRRAHDSLDLCCSCAGKKSYSDNPARAQLNSETREGVKLPERHLPRKFSTGSFTDGYIKYKKDGKDVFEHREVAATVIGRPLRRDEVVHHIDGDKLNNSVNNLYVSSNSEHSKIHANLEKVAFGLVKSGFIEFSDGRYFLSHQLDVATMPTSLEFGQVRLQQAPNKVNSRLSIDISTEAIRGVNLEVPLIASNMSTVTNADFCIKLSGLGALGVLHRAAAPNEMVAQVSKVASACEWVATSIGNGADQLELCTQLVKAGANIVFIDVAHGYNERSIELAKSIKKKYGSAVKVVIGNTINPGLLYESYKWVDAIKVGIGSGLACITKNTAGCYEGQFSAVSKFKKIARDFEVPVISDGGVRAPEDFVKAIGAGASSVMAGSLFAACDESAAILQADGSKLYAGMASEWVQKKWKGGLKPGTCAEGKVVYLPAAGPVAKVLEEYAGALRSGITYAGAVDTITFQDVAKFIRL